LFVPLGSARRNRIAERGGGGGSSGFIRIRVGRTQSSPSGGIVRMSDTLLWSRLLIRMVPSVCLHLRAVRVRRLRIGGRRLRQRDGQRRLPIRVAMIVAAAAVLIVVVVHWPIVRLSLVLHPRS